MTRSVPCPCCDGAGLVHSTWDEDEVLECVECDATGRVTPAQRASFVAWRRQCRRRRRGPRAGVAEDVAG